MGRAGLKFCIRLVPPPGLFLVTMLREPLASPQNLQLRLLLLVVQIRKHHQTARREANVISCCIHIPRAFVCSSILTKLERHSKGSTLITILKPDLGRQKLAAWARCTRFFRLPLLYPDGHHKRRGLLPGGPLAGVRLVAAG